MKPDYKQRAVSRKTLKTYPAQIVKLKDGTKVRAIRQTVEVPGYFADDRLESWEVTTMPKPFMDLGFGFGSSSSSVLASGRTLAEALEKAETSKYKHD